MVTPISPVGWQLTFDGETVTLFPSVGSWNFPCRSHYFIRRDTVVWGEDMTQYEIERGRAREQKAAISTLEYKRLSRQKHARRSFCVDGQPFNLACSHAPQALSRRSLHLPAFAPHLHCIGSHFLLRS